MGRTHFFFLTTAPKRFCKPKEPSLWFAYIGIKLERGSMYRTVVPELEKIPEVVECHFTTGPYTMLIKLYARDNQHLMELLNDKIQHISGVTATETLISLEDSLIREIPVFHTDEE